MNKEILLIVERMKEAWDGDPWYGRNIKTLLSEIDEITAIQKPSGQHSILELIWHMGLWKEFIISRLRNDNKVAMSYFETNDWRELDHYDKSLWKKGLQRYEEVHHELVKLVQQQKDEILDTIVSERKYSFRKLLNGIVEHDIYHIGQIAYVKKLVS